MNQMNITQSRKKIYLAIKKQTYYYDKNILYSYQHADCIIGSSTDEKTKIITAI
jgi:hypothetical protein